MTRLKRIALRTVLPPLVGGLLVSGLTLGAEFSQWSLASLAGTVAMILFGAYVIAILPSGLYALIMERAVSRGCRPGSRRSLALSAFLGLLVGSIPLCVEGVSGLPRGLEIWLLVMSSIGLTAGIIVECIVARQERRSALTSQPSDP